MSKLRDCKKGWINVFFIFILFCGENEESEDFKHLKGVFGRGKNESVVFKKGGKVLLVFRKGNSVLKYHKNNSVIRTKLLMNHCNKVLMS